MKKNHLFLLIPILLILSSCSEQLKISTGARDYEPLVFNNEYKTEDLKEITVDGSSFWGIPSFSKNNQNNRKNGFLFTFNGVQVGKTKRILPMLSLIGFSFGTARLVQMVSGEKEQEYNNSYPYYYYPEDEKVQYNLQFLPAWLIGLPIAGTFNNILWKNSAFSGASATLNYELVNQNPDIDVFFYPKYEITTKNGIWTRKATLKARVSGATLIHK